MIEFVIGFFLGIVIALIISYMIQREEKNHPDIEEAIDDMKFTLQNIIKKIESLPSK